MTPLIRDAQPKDIDELLPLLEQLFAIEADFNFDGPTQARGLKLMLDGCGKHRVVKVACQNRKIIGMCTAQTRISTAQGKITAVVEDLVVDNAHRGKGIGNQLLTAIQDWARMREIDVLQLLADKDNHLGIRFYRARDWKTTSLVCLTKKL